MGRTAALFSLIMSPLVIGVCLHSSLDQTEPHVFILSRDAQRTSQASLVILGAVDSVSRLQPPGKMMMVVMVVVVVMTVVMVVMVVIVVIYVDISMLR